ncbi:MAG: hypothetical protein KH347_07335, partial [Acetobacter sp.]|nr:hypothetical protein [Acetobacter sp.]
FRHQYSPSLAYGFFWGGGGYEQDSAQTAEIPVDWINAKFISAFVPFDSFLKEFPVIYAKETNVFSVYIRKNEYATFFVKG